MDAYEKVNKYLAKHGGSKANAFEKTGVTNHQYYYAMRKREGGDGITHEVQALEPARENWQLKHGNVVLAGSPQDLAYFLASLVGAKA